MPGIESQFYKAGLSEEQHHEFKASFTIVEEFNKKMYAKAKELSCWAFIVGTKKPTVVGFTNTHVKVKPAEIFIKMHSDTAKVGLIEEILVHDYVHVYKLYMRNSASRMSDRLKALFTYYDYQMFSSGLIQNMARNK